MNITILSVTSETKIDKNGKPYQVADVAYKNNTFQGKVEGKKLMPFGTTATACKTLLDALKGDTFEIGITKNEKGYNDWTSITKAEPGQAVSKASPSPSSPASTPVRTTYETPEERAQKQVYIIRQSSVSSAIAMLSVGSKLALDLETVLDKAKKIEAYVLGTGESGFDDFPNDDFPVVE